MGLMAADKLRIIEESFFLLRGWHRRRRVGMGFPTSCCSPGARRIAKARLGDIAGFCAGGDRAGAAWKRSLDWAVSRIEIRERERPARYCRLRRKTLERACCASCVGLRRC